MRHVYIRTFALYFDALTAVSSDSLFIGSLSSVGMTALCLDLIYENENKMLIVVPDVLCIYEEWLEHCVLPALCFIM